MLLDLLFKHITNVSVLLYEEIRVVKFKIPSVRKMQLHLVFTMAQMAHFFISVTIHNSEF